LILAPVSLDKLDDVWSWVREGLWSVKEKCSEPWIPEHIYTALRSGSAFLYTIEDAGFAVFQRHADVDGPVLFVWILHGKLAPYEKQLYTDIDELARGINARRIRWHSPRKGWAQRGYAKMKTIIYEREL
jgi:hypothetical protein